MVDLFTQIQPALGIVLMVVGGYRTAVAAVATPRGLMPYAVVSHLALLVPFALFWPGP